jgi:nicotinate-nucleotide pyrophosphorylase (carboxylating)
MNDVTLIFEIENIHVDQILRIMMATVNSLQIQRGSQDMPDFSALLPVRQVEKAVESWVLDDLPTFDVGALVVASGTVGTAHLFMKSPGVFAGKPFFDAVFHLLDCQCEWNADLAVEGQFLDPKSGKIHLATVRGSVKHILQGERTALNTISRCSGVATASAKAVQVARQEKWNGWVAGTRKTTPGSFRLVEKYGLLVGGAATHRLDLSQMTMLKDNHIVAAGSITAAVKCARTAAGFSQKIEVECQSLEEALEAANAGADIVMLDNFEPSTLKQSAETFKKKFPHVLVEASGGITVCTMKDYLCDSVDIVSQGSLTQGYDCIDFSLKIISSP